MKKIIPLILLLILSVSVLAQNNTAGPALTKADLLEKSKNQRTAGWVLMGTGTALTIAGGIVMIDALGNNFFENDNNYDRESTTAGVLVVTGLAAIGGSIPLFIGAHRNHKKAISLSFKNERVPQYFNKDFTGLLLPSVAIKFTL